MLVVPTEESKLLIVIFFYTGDHLGCKNGWHGWQNWCYYTPRHSEGLNWADSRAYCQQQGADLVSIHTQAEQDFVSTLIFYQCKFGFQEEDAFTRYQSVIE